MQLRQFNGGLVTRRAPELIQPNEAVVCHNVDLSSEQLVSAKGLGVPFAAALRPYFSTLDKKWYPNADVRTYVEHRKQLIYSDGLQAKKLQGPTWYDLGIPKPLVAPSSANTLFTPPTPGAIVDASPAYVALGAVGTIVTVTIPPDTPETQTFHITYYNATAGVESLPSPNLAVTAYPTWTTSPTISLGGAVSFTYSAKPINLTLPALPALAAQVVTHVLLYRTLPAPGSVAELVAIVPATDLVANTTAGPQPTLPLPGAGSGVVLQYVYTLYNTVDGTESQPSPISVELQDSGSGILISLPATLAPQVTEYRLYRLGNLQLQFTFLAAIPVTGAAVVYTDTTAAQELLGSDLLSELNSPPPATLKYLTAHVGRYFGSAGSKLYYSKQDGNPNYWPAVNSIEFNHEITGLASLPGGLVVFTAYETYGLGGNGVTNFSKYYVSKDQGCLSHNSIKSVKGSLLFVSADGICSLQGTTVSVVSKPALGKQAFIVANAEVFDEVYYLQTAPGLIYALDLRYTPAFYTLDFRTAWLVKGLNVLYGQPKGVGITLAPMFEGPAVELTYKTGNVAEGSTTALKTYKTVYIDIVGSFGVNITIGGTIVAKRDVLPRTKPFSVAIPQADQRGSSIQFELFGTGTVKEINYIVGVQTNG